MVAVSAAVATAFVAWSGRPFLPLVLIAVALTHPVAAIAAAGAAAAWSHLQWDRGPSPDDEARFIELIVTELDGGASLRSALLSASRRRARIDAATASRVAALGLPGRDVAAALREALPRNGRLMGAAWSLASESGAPAASVMRLLARRAADRGKLDRERRGLTAQARATAWLIAGLPVLLLALFLVTGRIEAGAALPVAAAGIGLQVVGIGLVLLMLRRAS